MEPRFDNCLRFSATRRDLFGLPRITFEYALSGRPRAPAPGALADLPQVDFWG